VTSVTTDCQLDSDRRLAQKRCWEKDRRHPSGPVARSSTDSQTVGSALGAAIAVARTPKASAFHDAVPENAGAKRVSWRSDILRALGIHTLRIQQPTWVCGGRPEG
jgi:hypothetical protein